MDERPDSLQEGLSSSESQPSSLAANSPHLLSEDTQDTQCEKTTAAAETRHSEDALDNPLEGEDTGPKSPQDQRQDSKTVPGDTLTHQPTSEDSKSKAMTSKSGQDKKSKATNSSDQKTDGKNTKNEKDTTTSKRPTLDQNANVEQTAMQTEATKLKGKIQQDQKQKTAPVAKQKMVFGPQTPKVILTCMKSD